MAAELHSKAELPLANTRCERLLTITRRLILMTLGAVILFAGVFALTIARGQKFFVSWACFLCGLVGGFVSIQQRLKRVSDEELELLSRSWFQILLIPIYGGVFALVLYALFLGQMIQGAIFPEFAVPKFSDPPTNEDLRNLFVATYPISGTAVAKLIFWCFVAGFSERLVPQIISKSSKDAGLESETGGDNLPPAQRTT